MSPDLTKDVFGPPPTCEIHHTVMHPEWVGISTGVMDYMIDYSRVVKQQFPHHGGVVLSNERGLAQPLARRVRDFVCDDCTAAYRAYWDKKQSP